MDVSRNSKPLQIFLANLCILILLKLAESKFNARNLERQTLHSYCRSFKNCRDCKRAASQCEWCHDIGCTNHAKLHCPKKLFLDSVMNKESRGRLCTEVTTKGPLFVQANARKFLKLDVTVDDLTLYEKDIFCEIHLEQRVIQVAASLDKGSLYCDTVVFKIDRNVVLGHLRILWGGADPYSNMLLLIVYNCKHLARTCRECQVLNSEFQCGWCPDVTSCTAFNDCPRQYGPWINKNLTCNEMEPRNIINHQRKHNTDHRSYWF